MAVYYFPFDLCITLNLTNLTNTAGYHGYGNSQYIMLFASLILGILSVTDPCFLRAQNS